MNNKAILNDKENQVCKRSKSGRKSFGGQNQSLNTSGFLKMAAREDMNCLNDKFSDYIDYVRSVESMNEKLRNEKQGMIDSFEQEISALKYTYGNEVDSLRKALDDVTDVKTILVLENKDLLEKQEKLNLDARNKSSALILLKKEFSELEDELNNMRKRFENYDDLKQENEALLKENNINSIALKHEICKRAEFENRLVTLTEEVEFYKKVSTNSKNSFDNKILSEQNVMAENIDIRINEEIQELKEELNEEFEQYKVELEKMYEIKFENLSKINEKSSLKCNSLYSEMKMLKKRIDELDNELCGKDNQVTMLNNRILTLNDLISKTNKDHDAYIADIMADNINLKKELEHKIIELAEVSNKKLIVEKELYTFQSLLDGENSRCNINDPVSPKRRRFAKESESRTDKNNFDITAWSNDKIKMFCDEQYNNNFIQLLNDSGKDVNINEWKIEFNSKECSNIYCFPNRVVKPGSILKVWSSGEEVIEDEDNIVMNVLFPVTDFLFCKLLNDMDGIEASFELKRIEIKRKILKAHPKGNAPEKCSIM